MRSFIILALLCFLILPIAVFAQTHISASIPGTNANSTSSAPGAFIANFYQFALMIGGILAFGVIVFGGIKYMASAGNPSGQTDGKEWIWGALTGLLLLAGAYLVLHTINPQLVNLNLPTLNQVVATAPYTASSTPPTTSSSTCPQVTTPGSLCTTANLANTCFSGNTALWSGICKNESRGDASLKSGSDYCLGPSGTGNYSVSVGLFQVNITNSWKQTVDGQNCSAAFVNGSSGAGQAVHCSGKSACTGSGGKACQIASGSCGSVSCMQLYNDCISAGQNGAQNINVACQISNSGSNTGPWKADAKKCGF
jgi:hypothetical protein